MKGEVMTCPVCNGGLPERGFKVSLNPDVAVIDGQVYVLGRRKAELLYVLSKNKHCFVSADDLQAKAYGIQDSSASFHAHMSQIRDFLKPTRWKVITADRKDRGRGAGGYMLTNEFLLDVDPLKVASFTELVGGMGLDHEAADEALRSVLKLAKR